jgi:hypothetical protein
MGRAAALRAQADALEAQAAALRAEADAIGEAPVADDLVRVRDLEIEARAKADLVRTGTLRTVMLGRERWTRRSWLLAAVDALPVARHVEAVDDLAAAAAKRAKRRVA